MTSTRRPKNPDAPNPDAPVILDARELRIVLGQLIRRLREQASMGDLTRSQTSALAELERTGPLTLTSLATAQGVRPQSMGTIVDVLTAAGLVTGSPHPTDGRKTLLSLTDTAREQFATGRLVREDWLHRAIQSRLSVKEQRELSASVELLRRLAATP